MTSVYIDAVKTNTPPDEFGEEVDAACDAIKEACAGWGTDEGALIEALGKLSPDMRYLVSLRYEELHGKKLDMVMDSECGNGQFGKALEFCAVSQPRAETKMLRIAMGGIGTKEELITPIVCGRTNEEMAILKSTYYDAYGKDLAVELSSELGGDYERFVFHCLQAAEEEFDEEYHTAEKVEEDVETFHEATLGSWGTDEKGIFQLIAKTPPAHLQAINAAYQEKYEQDLQTVLDTELGGQLEKAVRFATCMKLDPEVAVSLLIHKACEGFGTNEMQLTCAIIRYEPMLGAVNEKHVQLWGKSIYDQVEEETEGDYGKLLLAILSTEQE